MPIDIARETALKALNEINQNGAYSNIALSKHLENKSLRDMDRGLATELVYGTVKWKLTIDYIIERFSSVGLKKISPWIMDILRLGIYQLLFTDRIPPSAACNQCVELAKRYGHRASAGYVNGVLRTVLRSRNELLYPDRSGDRDSYLSVRYSYPLWLVKEWRELFGDDFAEELLDSGNRPPELTVRVNALKGSREDAEERLRAESVETAGGRYLKEALIIKNPPPLSALRTFREGRFQVQDESSMLVSRVLDPQPGELVIDACGAPGGKSTHIAELMGDRGAVISRDIHRHKLKLINDAASRLGLTIIKTELRDAVRFDSEQKGIADRVLVDAPCSGLGIIRRKPDIKWVKTDSGRREIIALQARILLAAGGYVRPGGVLVYSTCTIGPFENEEVVKGFIAENPEFTAEDIRPFLPDGLKRAEAEKGYIHLYPNTDGTDGFFICRLRRRKHE